MPSQDRLGVVAPLGSAVKQRHDGHHVGGSQGQTAYHAIDGREPGEGMGGHLEHGEQLDGHDGTTSRFGAGYEGPTLPLEHHDAWSTSLQRWWIYKFTEMPLR